MSVIFVKSHVLTLYSHHQTTIVHCALGKEETGLGSQIQASLSLKLDQNSGIEESDNSPCSL